MAGCVLTQGFDFGCRDGVGGLREVYILEVDSVASVTQDATGTVTAITKKTGKRFWKFKLARETSNATEAITGSEQNGTVYVQQTVQLVLNRRDADIRNTIRILMQAQSMVVAVDNTGKAFLYGQRVGLFLNGGTGDSGTAWADRNGWTLPLTGNEVDPAPQLATNVITTLETPGA